MTNNNELQRRKIVIFPELFYFGFTVLLSILTLSHTLFNDFFPGRTVFTLRLLSYMILILFVLLNLKLYSFTVKKMLLFTAFVILSLISFYYSRAYFILDLLVLGIASIEIDFRNILRVYLTIQISISIVTLLASFAGIFVHYDFGSRVNLFGDVMNRSSLGFRYTTLGVQVFFYISLAYWYLRRRSIEIYDMAIILLINMYLYNETGTRNAFLLIILEVIIMFIIYLEAGNVFKNLLDHKIIKYIFWIIFFISYYIGANFNSSNAVYQTIDEVTSGRAHLTHMAFEMFPAKLFGTNLYVQYQNYLSAFNMTSATSFLDSSYMQLFFNAGIIYTIVLLLLLTWILKKAIIKHNYYLVVVVLFIAVHSSMDPQLFEVSYNIFILLIFRYFIDNKSDKLKEIF